MARSGNCRYQSVVSESRATQCGITTWQIQPNIMCIVQNVIHKIGSTDLDLVTDHEHIINAKTEYIFHSRQSKTETWLQVT